jgi:hypothetical protein
MKLLKKNIQPLDGVPNQSLPANPTSPGIGATSYDYSGGGAYGLVLRFDGKTGYVSILDGHWNRLAPFSLLWRKYT